MPGRSIRYEAEFETDLGKLKKTHANIEDLLDGATSQLASSDDLPPIGGMVAAGGGFVIVYEVMGCVVALRALLPLRQGERVLVNAPSQI